MIPLCREFLSSPQSKAGRYERLFGFAEIAVIEGDTGP